MPFKFFIDFERIFLIFLLGICPHTGEVWGFDDIGEEGGGRGLLRVFVEEEEGDESFIFWKGSGGGTGRGKERDGVRGGVTSTDVLFRRKTAKGKGEKKKRGLWHLEENGKFVGRGGERRGGGATFGGGCGGGRYCGWSML